MIFNQLTTVKKIIVIVSSFMLAALALAASLRLTIAPSYPDFVVGNLAWSAGTKLQDLLAAPVFIIVFFLTFVLFSLILVRKERLLEKKQSVADEYRSELVYQLILWSLPVIAITPRLVLEIVLPAYLNLPFVGQFEIAPLLVSAAGIGFMAITTGYYRAKKIDVSPKILSLAAFAILLIALLPLEIALVLGRAPSSLVGEINLSLFVKASYAIAVSGLIVGLFYAMSSPQKLPQFLPKSLLVGQIGLCAIFLTLYPARLLQPDGVLIKYNTTVWLKILVVGVILCGVVDVIRRYRKHSATTDWTKVLSPIALFALLVGLVAGNTLVPYISPDDYHFGESLLGWWSYMRGVIPYIGFMPSHGLIDNYLAQFLSFIFYDGSAGSLGEASRLSLALLSFAAFIALYLFSGSISLAFLSTFVLSAIFFLSDRLTWAFLTPFLCLWFSRSLQENPSRWLSKWLLTAPLVILAVPPQGLLLVAASGVMAAHFAWRLWRCREKKAWTAIGVSLIILIFLGFVTPLLPMLFAAVRYVFENAPLNQVAYGIPWALSWYVAANAGVQQWLVFAFELVRMSWIVIPLCCLAIIYANLKDFAQRKHILLPAVVVLLFVLLLIPYSMGRIDPGVFSRPGYVAIFGWAILLPLAAWGTVKSKNMALLILLIACMGALFNFTPPSYANFLSAMSSKLNTPLLRDGASAEMANIGKAFAQDEHWDRLIRLNTLLNDKLEPTETYLDLTSRNAQYFYFNRRPVLAVTAPYNILPLAQQKRAVEQLSQNLPRLALLEGDNIIHDGGGLALRSHYLYRFIVDNYVPSYESGFIIGYEKTHAPIDHEVTVSVGIKELTDANWNQGFHRREAAVSLNDPYIISFVKEGDEVRLKNGDVRRVSGVWQESNALLLEGVLIEPLASGRPNRIQLVLSPQRVAQYRTALLQRAFSQRDLRKIPVAWGRSADSLEQRMTLAKNLDGIKPSLHQLIPEEGSYKLTGLDPFVSFDLSGLKLSGRDAGLLMFDFACVGMTAEPRLQVFWWGDDQLEPIEAFSVRFTAGNGTLIVPLDASPQWLTLKNIKGIRIDLDNGTACSAFSIKNIGLFQRRF